MEFKRLSDVEVVAEPAESANVLIEENGVIKKAPKSEIGRSAFEDIEIFIRIDEEPRIEYSGGTVPLQGEDMYWYFSDEVAGAKLVEALNDSSRFYRFIIYNNSGSIKCSYNYQTSTTPAFIIPWGVNELKFTKEEL